jgi:hypothetical protein
MTDASGYVHCPVPSSGCAISPDVATQEVKTENPIELGLSYPNPSLGETIMPFTLAAPADVRLDVLDAMGRKVAGVVRKGRMAGQQSIKLNLTGLGLPPGDYVYRFEATTRGGVFRQSKVMTVK